MALVAEEHDHVAKPLAAAARTVRRPTDVKLMASSKHPLRRRRASRFSMAPHTEWTQAGATGLSFETPIPEQHHAAQLHTDYTQARTQGSNGINTQEGQCEVFGYTTL